jgi:hypothetical protein
VLVKRNKSGAKLKEFFKHLTVDERLLLSHHKDIRYRNVNATHDAIAAYIACRAFELPFISACIGEYSSRISDVVQKPE